MIPADGAASRSPNTYPEGFRPRRGLNWLCVGLTYSSFYMCRYSLSFVNKGICDEFHFSKADFGWVLTAFFWAYALGQFVNGLFTDLLGGKRAMIIGAIGTIILNLAFGAASFVGILWVFIVIRMLDGYMQSFGAPGMIKINAAWFAGNERGRFAGIFGFMIQLGRFAINYLAPALLAGFSLVIFTIPPLHWRWVFWVPAGMTLLATAALAIFVKDTPEEAGWPDVIEHGGGKEDEVALPLTAVLKKILTNKMVWICALAYFSTGVVRQGIDQWFPRYLEDVHKIPMNSSTFMGVAFLLPFVAVIGSFLSGYVSDVFFGGQRAPVAMALYLAQTVVILAATQFSGLWVMCFFLLLISFMVNSTHSILGTAAAMDIGGRKMAGFASGVIDSFQYIGGGLAGFFLGKLLDQYGWSAWLYSLAGFGLIGAFLMYLILPPKAKDQPAQA